LQEVWRAAIDFQLEVGDAHGFNTMLRVVHPFDGE
jgi:hypothetical protein